MKSTWGVVLFRSCEYFPSAELELAAQKIGVNVKHIDSLSNNTARLLNTFVIYSYHTLKNTLTQ